MSQMVLIYHPDLPETQLPSGTPKLVALSAVDNHYARGWLLVDPEATPPPASTPYYTRAELLSQIQGGGSPIGTALKEAFGTEAKALARSGRLVPRRADGAPGQLDPYVGGLSAVPSGVAAPAAGGGKLVRWVATRTGRITGLMINVLNATGNGQFSVYDDSFLRLGGTAGAAMPAVGSKLVTFDPSIDVEAGRSYFLAWGADNTTASLTGVSTVFNLLTSNTSNLQTGGYPAAARINLTAMGGSFNNGVTAPTLVPVYEPALIDRLGAPFTTPFVEMFSPDPLTGRIFGRHGNSQVAWSDDNGATKQQSSNGFAGEVMKGVAFAGDYLFVAFHVTSGNTGRIRRYPRTGPYQVANATVVLDAQEGYSVPWNLAAYADGTVFVGNYTAPSAAQVRVRRSTDFGATWTVVLDLGAGGTNANHVHSIMRDPDDPTIVYCNVGDSGLAQSGCYLSTDGGATFTRKAAFGDIKLTPVIPLEGGALFASDQTGHGGQLFLHDPDADTLTPRSFMPIPWNGNVYGMSQDDDGLIWYFTKGGGANSTQRAAIFVSPDGGRTSWLAYDLGDAENPSYTIFRLGDFVFTNTKRYPVGALAAAGPSAFEV